MSVRRVLVACPDESLRRLYRLCLEDKRAFHVVGEAGTSAEAVKRTRELRPDLVLLDDELPGIDAKILAEELHSLLPSCWVVLQGDPDLGPVPEMVSSGAGAWIPKTLDPSKLAALLDQILRGRGTRV